MFFFLSNRLGKWSTNAPFFFVCLGFVPKEARIGRGQCTQFLEATKMSLGIWDWYKHLHRHSHLDLVVILLKPFHYSIFLTVSEIHSRCPVRPAVACNFRSRSNTNGKASTCIAVFLQLIHVVGNVPVMILWRLYHRQRSMTSFIWALIQGYGL